MRRARRTPRGRRAPRRAAPRRPPRAPSRAVAPRRRRRAAPRRGTRADRRVRRRPCRIRDKAARARVAHAVRRRGKPSWLLHLGSRLTRRAAALRAQPLQQREQRSLDLGARGGGVGRVGDHHRRLDHRAEQHVRERLDLATTQEVGVHRLLQRHRHESEPMLRVDFAPLGPAEHRRRVEVRYADDGRVLAGVEERAHASRERFPRVGAARGPRDDRAEHLVCELSMDGAEEVSLVAEVVVERAARHVGRAHDLLRADVGVAARGEQLPRDAQQLGARGGSLLLPLHTICMLGTYSLYVSRERSGGMGNAHWRADELGDARTLELDGGRLRAHLTGDGPAVVFVHGLLVNANLWRKVVPLLDGFTRVTLDLPLGSHLQPMPGRRLTPDDLAALIGEAVQALGLDDVTLVGNDTGGALCQIAASHRPPWLGRLVLTPCDAFEHFPPRVFKPLFGTLAAPGGARAVLTPLRSRALRRLPVAYGWLVHEPIPDA